MSKHLAVYAACLALLAQSISPTSAVAEPVLPSAPLPSDAELALRSARALAAANKLIEAEAAYREALAAAERLQGPDGLTVAQVLNWEAVFLQERLHRSEEAWKLAERAIAIRREKLGPYHLDTAALETVLAWIALSQSDSARAQPHYQAVFDAYERHPSKELEVSAALAARQRAVFLHDQSRFQLAEGMMKRCIEIKEQFSKPDYNALTYDY